MLNVFFKISYVCLLEIIKYLDLPKTKIENQFLKMASSPFFFSFPVSKPILCETLLTWQVFCGKLVS